jgi:hypothetical protein
VRKFKMEDSKAMATLMSMTAALDADEEGEHVDQKEYWSMIGSVLYLTVTRPDALVFKHHLGLCIGKRLRAFSSICVTLPTSAFGTSHLLRCSSWFFRCGFCRVSVG